MSATWSWVSFAYLDELRSSGQTQAVPPESWMTWTHRMKGLRGVWGQGWEAPRPNSSNRADGAGVVGELWVIRDDPKDVLPLNAYRYLLFEMLDGSVMQLGPLTRGSDVSHHLAELPSWATEG